MRSSTFRLAVAGIFTAGAVMMSAATATEMRPAAIGYYTEDGHYGDWKVIGCHPSAKQLTVWRYVAHSAQIAVLAAGDSVTHGIYDQPDGTVTLASIEFRERGCVSTFLIDKEK